MNNYEQAHGTVYFDPIRGFIQVRETYFEPKNKPYSGYLHTGHFARCLSDAKNNVPDECITVDDLKRMINIEEVGLRNIKGIHYEPFSDTWWVDKPCREHRYWAGVDTNYISPRYCSQCGKKL